MSNVIRPSTLDKATLVFTIAFCAWSNVVATSPDMLRPQAGTPYGAAVGSFLFANRIEPAW
jgi:hypothetical protein